MKNYILWKKKSELDKAYEYEKSLQKNGIIKNFRLYNKMLDEYAVTKGFWNWDDMIQAYINDEE